ncbi:MAG TPA: ABC transporter substrate-binding protein [Candidatus Binataceae bacterium]|nr:ABC transporter substrate-binding protein [Candidatus Binataceae bacterium]
MMIAVATPRVAPCADRIVTLVPSVTETLFALGVGDEVVGVSSFDDYPPQVRNLPKVGSFLTPNLEAIAALRPTLVIGRGISSNQRELRAMRAMGYEVLTIEDDSLAQIEQSIRTIGARLGKSQQASTVIASIEASVNDVRARVGPFPEPRTLMLVGHQPIVAVGPGTFLDDLLKIARADNIADASSQQWPQLSMEFIVAMRPEVIIDGQMGSEAVSPSQFWQAYPTIPAVRNNRVVGYPEDPTLHPGPRVGTTLEMIAKLVHPEAWTTAR